jgi:hypothetical protein
MGAHKELCKVPLPIQSPLHQGGDIGPDNRFEANITGYGEQHDTHADGQIPHPCCALAEVDKFMRKSWACVDFQEDLRQIDLGDASEDGTTDWAYPF